MARKLSYFVIFLFACMIFTSCSSCGKSSEGPILGDGASNLVFENVISTDREAMFLNYDEDYRWYESTIVAENFFDSDSTSSVIKGITNVFQVAEKKDSTCFDIHVIMMKHDAVNTYEPEAIEGFWIEDFPLNEEKITLTYEEAYARMMMANCVKPHSRYCVLRKQVGPVDCNPQYIFGNVKVQVYVDAVTGQVSNNNPAFGKIVLKKPLGEWP